MSFVLSISFKAFTCLTCGCSYAVPEHLTTYTCPSCASRREHTLRVERNEAQARVEALTRQISHMRGALTRVKKRKLRVASGA